MEGRGSESGGCPDRVWEGNLECVGFALEPGVGGAVWSRHWTVVSASSSYTIQSTTGIFEDSWIGWSSEGTHE